MVRLSEVHGTHHIRDTNAANDQGRVPINHAIPDLADAMVASVIWSNQWTT
jgi:hypothetical protein